VNRRAIISLILAGIYNATPVPAKGAILKDDSLHSVPDWARSAVWYQIFPERFRNGDPANDPTVADIAGAWPSEIPDNWTISKWTGDWYALQPWEQADNKGFYFNAQLRRYGGDLQGVLEKLDYLQDLGVTALYFNPLFESPSLHKYDATMYHHIDNNFGPNPEGDRDIRTSEDPADAATWKWTSADSLFLQLIREVHRRQMKIIIDGVFNHVGRTFWAFQDVRKKGRRSQFRDWFTIRSWDNPDTPDDEFDYVGWHGVKELPELREDSNGLVHGPREHVHQIIRRWMDPNNDGDPSDGVDGWRLDVADMVAIPFWREFRKWVREMNPQAYLVGEVWWEDWKNDRMFNATPWLRGDVFDAVMNYRVAQAAGLFFKDRKNKISASEFSRRLDRIRNDYRRDATEVLMNTFDSHDTDRLASQIVNPDTRYDGNVNVAGNREYNVRKPTASEWATFRLMVLFQMTYVGAPCIYYGDEVGMWGADDPDERKPMLWSDMHYDDETSHPFGLSRPRDVNSVDTVLFAWYKRLIAIRKSTPALSRGTCTPIVIDDAHDLLGFLRSWENKMVIVILNNADTETLVTLSPSATDDVRWTSILGPVARPLPEGHLLSLPPRSGTILVAERQ